MLNVIDQWRVRIVQIALDDLGIFESTGHNRGPQIDKWAFDLGLPPGLPWCLIFGQHVVRRAASEVGYIGPTLPRTGRVSTLVARCSVNDPRYFRPALAAIMLGDANNAEAQLLMHLKDPNDPNSVGHFGIRIGPNEGLGELERVITIEGNTNEEGSREGTHVMRKKRPKAYWNAGLLDLSFAGLPRP